MIALRGYQREAVDFFGGSRRAILADDPGLGKTFPAVEAAVRQACRAEDGDGDGILVVCPPYLIPQWRGAIAAYLRHPESWPSLRLERKDPPLPDGGWAFAVTGYHTLLNGGVLKHPELLTRRWRTVVFDEAHRLRGRRNQWTKNAFRLKADHILMLTGTPVVNNPGDLWPLLHLCDPKRFRSYWRFVEEWCQTCVTPWATEVLGVKPGLEPAFHDMLDGYLLRRRIEDHLPELPPQIDHEIRVELPPATRRMHDRAKKVWRVEHPDLDDPVAVLNGGALVAKLRQVTSGFVRDEDGVVTRLKDNPKRDAVVDLLEDHPNEPVVVFCWFRETAHLLAQAIRGDGDGRRVVIATGETSPQKRAEDVEAWKATPNGVVVATIPSLQEGANLQHARTVVFAEHDYLPTSIQQAVARVRRFGQQFPVNVYHVLADRSVDTVVWSVLHARHGRIERALLEGLYAPEQPMLAA